MCVCVCVCVCVSVKGSRGVVVNVLDCDIVVNKFEVQLYYYIHFGTNDIIPPAMG